MIDPEYRGLGYSKIMMAATEGIARTWGRDFVCLHADADFRNGKIAQRLYEGLGYELVKDGDPQYSWMQRGGDFDPMSSVRMVEGVALLFYKKNLN